MEAFGAFRPTLVCLVGAGILSVACDAHHVSSPDRDVDEPLPDHVLQALQGIELGDGPLALFEGKDRNGRLFAAVDVRREATRDVTSDGLGSDSRTALIQASNLPLVFSVHPNGGRRDDLRSHEIHGLTPAASGGFIFGCVENGQFVQYLDAEVDSLVHKNFGTPTGGHGADHSFANDSTGRPLGTHEPDNGPTLADGRFYSTFTPNIAAGDEKLVIGYRVTDPAAPCVGIPAESQYRVVIRVPDLVELTATSSLSLSPPTSHPKETFWYVDEPTEESTERLADAHLAKYGNPLLLTAAALKQGGIQDICMDWDPAVCGHWEHRVGTDIDIDDQLANDQKRLKEIELLGETQGRFADCEPHPRASPNHVHCRQRLY